MLPDSVSAKELAQVLGCSPRQIQVLASKGALPQLSRDRFALGPQCKRLWLTRARRSRWCGPGRRGS
jgi:hypothetical protein